MNQFSEISDLATGTVTVTCVNDLPMLTVLGLPSVTIYRYTPYVDSGATAVDLEDGDIS